MLFVLRHQLNGLKQEEWLTRSKQNWENWSFNNWKGTTTELPFDLQQVALGYTGSEVVYHTTMPIYQGQLTGLGGSSFLIFAGYRLMDGTVICNCQNPLVLHVVN